MEITKINKNTIVYGLIGLALLAFIFFVFLYDSSADMSYSGEIALVEEIIEPEEVFVVTHLETPDSVRAIYMTNWVAGSKKTREKIVKLIEETEINAIVIDVKDYTGKVGFKMDNALVQSMGSIENRVPDMKEFIGELHEKNIYVIGRITVFQDPHLVSKRPDLAVKRSSDGGIWADRKGITWLDPAGRDVWDYVIEIAKESYDIGFDELNFDYIRFPSDGNMKDIAYPHYGTLGISKAAQIEKFFVYLDANTADTGMKLSADLFGMTATNTDDLNIGQVLERAAPHFDYIAPMVYPSHYPKGFNGHEDVNAVPYEIVKYSMDRASQRLIAASSSPEKLRPWLQDNNYPVPYTPAMVRAQIQATYDAGLDSWMLWDAANTYTRAALKDAREGTD